MVSTRILDVNPELGTTELFHYDDVEDKATIETIAEVGELVEANKALFNEHTSLDRFGEFNRVASIPMSIYFDLKAKGIIDDPAALKRWLNDPDNRFFRTRPGVI